MSCTVWSLRCWAKLAREWSHHLRVLGHTLLSWPFLALIGHLPIVFPQGCPMMSAEWQWLGTRPSWLVRWSRMGCICSFSRWHSPVFAPSRILQCLLKEVSILCVILAHVLSAWGWTWHFRTKLVATTMITPFEKPGPLARLLGKYVKETSQSSCASAPVCELGEGTPVVCGQSSSTFRFVWFDSVLRIFLFQGRKMSLILFYFTYNAYNEG